MRARRLNGAKALVEKPRDGYMQRVFPYTVPFGDGILPAGLLKNAAPKKILGGVF